VGSHARQERRRHNTVCGVLGSNRDTKDREVGNSSGRSQAAITTRPPATRALCEGKCGTLPNELDGGAGVPSDRFGRGRRLIRFNALGFRRCVSTEMPRIIPVSESDLRTEGGVEFGEHHCNVDFAYLAR